MKNKNELTVKKHNKFNLHIMLEINKLKKSYKYKQVTL